MSEVICAHCGEVISDKAWKVFINEAGTDLDRVHSKCEAAYEQARDQRAAAKVKALAPARA